MVGRLLHFLTHGAPLARFARESSGRSVMENQSSQKEVAVFYEKWLLIRGANYDALTGINLYFVGVAVLFVGWFF